MIVELGLGFFKMKVFVFKFLMEIKTDKSLIMGSGNFGVVQKIYIEGKTYAAKFIKMKRNEGEIPEKICIEYFLAKLLGNLGIGPKV